MSVMTTPRNDKQGRRGDRHKKRHMIGLRPTEYAKLQAIADKHQRPVLWQLRIILEDAFKREGV